MLQDLDESDGYGRKGSASQATADQVDQPGLPATLQEVITGRVRRLGPAVQSTLELAAVMGSDFDLETLAQVSSLSFDGLVDAVDRAAAAALLRPDASPGQYCFAHGLVRRAVYGSIGPANRAYAHRRVAVSIEQDRPYPLARQRRELAHHWLLTGRRSDLPKAFQYNFEAGAAALEDLDPHDAIRYFSCCLDLIERSAGSEPSDLLRVMVSLGIAQRHAGVPLFRDTLLDAANRALDLHEPRLLVEAALANSRGFPSSFGVVDIERVHVLERALEATTDADSPERARLLAMLCMESTYGTSLAHREELANAARTIADRLADPRTTVGVLNLLELPLQVPHTLSTRLADTAVALKLATELDDPVQLFWAANHRRIAASQAGLIEPVDECLALMESLSASLRQPTLVWATRFHRAVRSLVSGNPDEAERSAREAVQIGTESGQPDAFAYYLNNLMVVRWQQGRLRELLPVITRAVVDNPLVPALRAAQALAHSDADEGDAALHLLHATVANGLETLPVSTAWADSMVCWAEIAIVHGAPEAAARLYELLEPWHDQFVDNGSTTEGPISHYLGGLATQLGRYRQAETFFEESLGLSEGMRAKFFTARTQLSWAAMLVARGRPADVDRTQELLAQSLTTATECGYATVARRAAALMRSAGSS